MSMWDIITRVFEGFLWPKKKTRELEQVKTQSKPLLSEEALLDLVPAEHEADLATVELIKEESKSEGSEEDTLEGVEVYIEPEPEKREESVGVVVIDDPEVLGLLDEENDVVDEDPFEGADPAIRAKELAKGAVNEKNNDIAKAVRMMEEVVRLQPTEVYLSRLSYYYSLQGNWRAALAIITERLSGLDQEDIGVYFSAKATLLDDARKVHSRHGDSQRAIFCELESAMAALFGRACRGELGSPPLDKLIKGNTLLKELKQVTKNASEVKEKIVSEFTRFVEEVSAELTVLDAAVKRAAKKSAQERKSALASNSKVQEAYKKISTVPFQKFIDEKISKLLDS